MEFKKYNPFVIKPPPKSKTKPKPNTKLEARGLSLENKKRLDTIHAKVLLSLVGNSLSKIMTITLTIRITTRLYQPFYYHHY